MRGYTSSSIGKSFKRRHLRFMREGGSPVTHKGYRVNNLGSPDTSHLPLLVFPRTSGFHLLFETEFN